MAVADGGKYARTCENVRKRETLISVALRAGGVISQEFVVRLFGFFVIHEANAIDRYYRLRWPRAHCESLDSHGGRWKVRAARSGKSRVITNAHDPS